MNFSSVYAEIEAEGDLTAEQKRKRKFHSSAFVKFLAGYSEDLDASMPVSYRPNNVKLSPVRIIKRLSRSKHPQKIPTPVKLIAKIAPTAEDTFDVYWTKASTLRWNPETRQQATLTAVGNSLYLIGGISRDINQDVNTFNPYSRNWEKLKTSGITEARFGHSALEYNSQIYIFGGGTNFNLNHRLRECINGVRKFVTSSNQWTYLKTSGTYISARKGHAASIIGKHMLISGGLNDKQRVLNDTAILNLQKSTWNAVDLSSSPFSGQAFHTAATVCSSPSTSSIYKYSDTKISFFGIYLFGGINNQKQATNTLFRIIPGTRPLVCIIPPTSGIPPSPRFMHTMSYCASLNYLIIFGGRVDVKNATSYTCFNDVHLLCIDSLAWVKVRVTGNVPLVRSAHCANIIGSEMFIFGGVSNTCYCSSEVYKLEVNQNIVKGMIKSDERRKTKERLYRNKSLVENMEIYNTID